MTSVEQPSASFRPPALIGGSFSSRAAHLPFISDLVAALKPSVIVQQGVGYGDTYFGLCQLVAENHLACSVYGIDTWMEKAPVGKKPRASAFALVSQHNKTHYHSFSHLLCKTLDESLSQFQNESISLLDMGGLQPYDTLKRTFESWLEKVQPGGVVLLHDISVRSGDSGAAQLWNEIKATFPHFAFRHSDGLGIIAKSFNDAVEIPFVAEMFTAQPEERNLLRRYYASCAARVESDALAGALPPSEDPALFQVFRSTNHQYSQLPEFTHLADPGVWTNVRVDLPDGAGDLPLRLEFSGKPAVVDIAALTLRKDDGHTVWSWNPKDAADPLRAEGGASRLPEPEFFRVLALGPAAQIYLPELGNAVFGQPLELEIRFRVDVKLKGLKDLTQQKPADLLATSAALEAAVAKVKADSAKFLAQSRIEYEAKLRQATADADARVEAIRIELDSLRSEMELLKMRHRQDMEGQAALLEQERAHHQATRLEKETILAQRPLMLQEISIAQGNVDELKAELERISSELATTEFDLAELRKLNVRMAAALEQERGTRVQMEESGSWQLTKPIRAVGELFGPRRKY